MAEWLEKIIEALDGGATVVTVNQRLSQHLHSTYKEVKSGAGNFAWETPTILPIGAWVSRLYEEARSSRPVLGESRSRAMWVGIVERGLTAEQRRVLFAQGVGETSYSAYKLMGEYCITAAGLGPELYMTEEARAFKGWLNSYSRKLDSSGFIDRIRLKSRVVEEIKEGNIPLPGSVLFAGFDELTPAVRLLALTLKESGVDVEDLGCGGALGFSSAQEAQPVLKEYADEVEEVRAAARRVREKLSAGLFVGVVVTDLNRYCDLIEREFGAELDPASVVPWQAATGVFNISLGAPLYETPFVRSAFALLEIVDPGAPIDSTTSLLFTLAGSAGEQYIAAISEFDVRLKREKISRPSLIELKGLMEKRGRGVLAVLAKRIGSWVGLLSKESSKELPGCWARRFADMLRLVGWPSTGLSIGGGNGRGKGGGLTSGEYQAIEAWQSVLIDFSCFDDTLGHLTRTEAVARLKRLAVETIHRKESPDSPVQVLGLFEAAGLNFDSILLLGADSSTLPMAQSPNPFIPVEVQKRLNFKDSTPERTLSFASSVLERVLKSAPSVEISYARCFNGVEAVKSPLLKNLDPVVVPPFKESKGIARGSSLKEGLHAACALEELTEEPNVRLPDEERENLCGGTNIIKDQSACPFKAFATHRLGARGMSVVEPGFDAMDRGITVHEALKFFWRKVKNSKRLKEAFENSELTSLVCESVSKAMAGNRGRNLPVAYLELESRRVEALVAEWLTLELSREDFTVKATESEEKIDVGGLRLQAYFDRVDTLEGGGELIIDYKTGECSQDSWLPGRPKEPQLLLYDLAGGFDALAFGRIKIKNTKFVAVAKDGAGLPGVKPVADDKWRQGIEGVENWDDLKLRWKETLEVIAKEFVDGVTSLTPDSSLKNSYPCKYCDLSTLCRRFELNAVAGRL